MVLSWRVSVSHEGSDGIGFRHWGAAWNAILAAAASDGCGANQELSWDATCAFSRRCCFGLASVGGATTVPAA